MGNVFNPNDKKKQIKGGLMIQIQKIVYVSNEQIQGTIHISTDEAYPGYILNLKLIGFEKTQYIYRTRSNKRTVVHHAKGFDQFLNYSTPIYDFSNGDHSDQFQLQPGQWSIPFSLVIADKLPSSIHYELNQNYKCDLSYYLVAFIAPSDNKYQILSSQQQIFIGQQIIVQNEQTFFSIQSSPETCCCCGNGVMQLACNLEKQTFVPGEIINMNLNCDLTLLKIKTQKMIVRLQGLIIMKSQANRRNFSKIINYVEMDLPIQSKMVQQQIKINIPQNCYLTANGKLVSFTYTISVEVVFDQSCISSNQQLIVPITINPNHFVIQHMVLPQLPQISAPQNWQPQQLQQQQYDSQKVQLMRQQTQRYIQNGMDNTNQVYEAYENGQMVNQNKYL